MSNLRKETVEYYFFYCPACKCEHTYTISSTGLQWHFNGNTESPTFTPSLLNTIKDENGKITHQCHLFITDGNIVFCNDCTHELSGLILPLV